MKTKDWKFSGAGAAHTGMFGRPTILREGEDDKPGGGDDKDKKKKTIDDDTRKEIVDLIHSTFTEREKRDAKKRGKEMEDAITKALAPVLEKLSANPDPGDDGDKGDKKPPTKKPDNSNLPPEVQAILAKQAKEIEALKTQNEQTKAEKDAERTARKRNEEVQNLTEELQGKVRPNTLKGLLSYLRAERVVRDEEDETKILWKGDKEGELLPLKDGIASWLKGDEGKEYVAARDAGGGGTGRERGSSKLDPNAVASDADIGAIITMRR